MRPETLFGNSVPRLTVRDAVEVGRAARRLRREACAARVATGDGAPLGQQLRQIERIDATIRHTGRTRDVREGEIRRDAVLARRARRDRIIDGGTPRPEHGPEVERINAAVGYIRKQKKKGVKIEHISRDGVAKATGVPSTAVSGTRAWKALAEEKKRAKLKPPLRGPSTTKDDDLLRGKAGENIDAAIDRQEWETVEKGQQREQRSQR